MKLVIAYISLLLICGLMFSLSPIKRTAAVDEPAVVKTCALEAQRIKKCVTQSVCPKTEQTSFSFVRDVLASLIPVLK